jgi:hypothetical protein
MSKELKIKNWAVKRWVQECKGKQSQQTLKNFKKHDK